VGGIWALGQLWAAFNIIEQEKIQNERLYGCCCNWFPSHTSKAKNNDFIPFSFSHSFIFYLYVAGKAL